MIYGIFVPSKITKYQIMKILYFTATGNCLYVAKQLGGELLSIPQLMKSGTFSIEDDVVGVVNPVYCADMPKMAQRIFMSMTPLLPKKMMLKQIYDMQTIKK